MTSLLDYQNHSHSLASASNHVKVLEILTVTHYVLLRGCTTRTNLSTLARMLCTSLLLSALFLPQGLTVGCCVSVVQKRLSISPATLSSHAVWFHLSLTSLATSCDLIAQLQILD